MNVYYLISLIEFIFIWWVIVFRNKKGLKSFFFDPLNMFLTFSSLIYLVIPVVLDANDSFFDQDSYKRSTLLFGNLLAFSYIFFVAIIYLGITMNWKAQKEKVFRSISKKEINYILIIVVIPFLIGSFVLFKRIFSYPSLNAYMSDRIKARVGLGPAVMLFYQSYFLLSFYLFNTIIKAQQTKKKETRRWIYLTFFTIITAFSFVISGNRFSILIIFLFLFAIYIVLMPKLTKKAYTKIIIIGFSLGAFLAILGVIRTSLDEVSTGDFSRLTEKNDNKDVLIEGIYGAWGNMEKLFWLIENDEKWQPLYGKTFLAGLLGPFPRKLWKNKPLGGGPKLKNFLHPGSYSLNSKKAISSYTTGILIESYMNFKFFGIFIIGFFHGFILALLKLMSLKLRGNPLLVAIYIYLSLAATFFIIYGEFLGIYSRILLTLIPTLLVYFLSRLRFKPLSPISN